MFIFRSDLRPNLNTRLLLKNFHQPNHLSTTMACLSLIEMMGVSNPTKTRKVYHYSVSQSILLHSLTLLNSFVQALGLLRGGDGHFGISNVSVTMKSEAIAHTVR